MSENPTFLSLLLAKKAAVIKTGSERGLKPINTSALEKEVDRQVKQVSTGGDIVRGTGVTKSEGADESDH